MTISFPKTTFSISRATQLADSVEHRTLIIGQKQASGSALAGVVSADAPADDITIGSRFGARSHIAQMLRAFKAINGSSAVDVLALEDNAGGVNATAEVGFTGTATENGTFFVEVASGAQRRYKVDVLTGDTAPVIAARLEALTDADGTAPFTSAVTSGDVTFTAANAGSLANDWHVHVDGIVAGITFSITAWSGGATDPVLTNLFDAIDSVRYQTIVWPQEYVDTVLKTELDARFNVSNGLLQGVGVITAVETAANIITKAAALNSQSIVVIAAQALSKQVITGNALREMPDVVSARFAALRALRLTDDASLAQFLTTPAPLDQFGSRALASLPYANTIVPNQAIIRNVDQWTQLQLETFKDNGVSVIGANRGFSSMILGEFVTTNTTDAASNPDTSFALLNTVDTIAAIRDAHDINFRRRYAQSRLTNGALIPGRDLANQASIEAFVDEIYQALADDALVEGGEAALASYKATGRVVAVDVPNGRVSVDIAPVLINGLRVVVGTVTVNFGA